MSLQQIAVRLQLPIARRGEDRRRSFRVDPEFQNRFRLRILALALFIMLVVAMVSVGAVLATRLPPFSQDTILLQIVVAGLALGEGFLIFLICDRFSHRYCGPVYRMQKTLEAVRREERPDPIRLRSQDEFGELAGLLNSVLVQLGVMDGPVADAPPAQTTDPGPARPKPAKSPSAE